MMPLATNPDYNALLNLMVEQATVFLDEMGSFYPFGATVTTDGNAIPLGIYLDEELETTEILALLEQAVAKKFAEGDVRAAAVGLDVNFRTSPAEAVQPAIQVKLTHIHEAPLDYYLIYALINGKSSIQKCLFYQPAAGG